MSTFRSSSSIERAFQWDKQWQTPGRREHVHGPVQSDLPKSNRLWLWVGRVIITVCSVYALSLWIVK